METKVWEKRSKKMSIDGPKNEYLIEHAYLGWVDKEYETEYSYLLFLYGDLFKNILRALHLRKDMNFRIPERYKEATFATVDFYNKWYGGKNGTKV